MFKHRIVQVAAFGAALCGILGGCTGVRSSTRPVLTPTPATVPQRAIVIDTSSTVLLQSTASMALCDGAGSSGGFIPSELDPRWCYELSSLKLPISVFDKAIVPAHPATDDGQREIYLTVNPGRQAAVDEFLKACFDLDVRCKGRSAALVGTGNLLLAFAVTTPSTSPEYGLVINGLNDANLDKLVLALS